MMRLRSITSLVNGLIFIGINFLAAGIGTCQSGTTPKELIKSLTQLSDLEKRRDVGGCGHTEEIDKAWLLTEELAKCGVSAAPDIEYAFDSLERYGSESEFASSAARLLLAYAQIEERAALPRLRRMLSNPKLEFLRVALDGSIAFSLGITSYISEVRAPVKVFHCSRQDEPRDALDQAILAVERNDRGWLESVLGPKSMDALNSLDNRVSRSKIWLDPNVAAIAVGYHFTISGRWSEPESTFESRILSKDVSPYANSTNFTLDTRFVDAAGHACGTQEVQFTRAGDPRIGDRRYLINGPDLQNLIQVILSCLKR